MAFHYIFMRKFGKSPLKFDIIDYVNSYSFVSVRFPRETERRL